METATSPEIAAADMVLQSFRRHDVQLLVDALEPDATMRALLPGGVREWAGAAVIGEAFARWFGGAEHYEVADATLSQIGDLLALRWRLRLRADRLGDEVMVVEQQTYATTGPTGLIAHLSLLCSGFWPQRRHVGALPSCAPPA